MSGVLPRGMLRRLKTGMRPKRLDWASDLATHPSGVDAT